MSKALFFNELKNIFYPLWACEAAYIHNEFFLKYRKSSKEYKAANGPDYAQDRSCLICTSEKQSESCRAALSIPSLDWEYIHLCRSSRCFLNISFWHALYFYLRHFAKSLKMEETVTRVYLCPIDNSFSYYEYEINVKQILKNHNIGLIDITENC